MLPFASNQKSKSKRQCCERRCPQCWSAEVPFRGAGSSAARGNAVLSSSQLRPLLPMSPVGVTAGLPSVTVSTQSAISSVGGSLISEAKCIPRWKPVRSHSGFSSHSARPAVPVLPPLMLGPTARLALGCSQLLHCLLPKYLTRSQPSCQS